MKSRTRVFLILTKLVLMNFVIHAQYKTNIKTNVLSLLITTPQLSFEQQVTEKSSITLSGYKGKFTFISVSRIQGANLLYRNYGKTGLRGFYKEFGASLHAESINNTFNYNYGPRAGLGYQFGKNRWAFDLGIGFGFYIDRIDNFDQNSNIIGKRYMVEPKLRLNTSIGIRF